MFKIENIQHKAVLATAGTIQGISRQKLYSELGFYSLSKKRWDSKLICLGKIWNGFLPKHLHLYLTFSSQENYPFRSVLKTKINSIPWRIKSFRKTFFPYCINEWNKLNAKVGNAKSSHFFKKIIVIGIKVKSLFSVYEPLGVKLLMHIRLQFSHLDKHKFKHGFGDTVGSM